MPGSNHQCRHASAKASGLSKNRSQALPRHVALTTDPARSLYREDRLSGFTRHPESIHQISASSGR
jgi:hypothetical protein